jgi:hypothetical protein
VIVAKQAHGLENAKAALRLKPNTDQNVTQMGAALLWAFCFVNDNYEGDATVLADVILLLEKLGLLDGEAITIQ